MLLVMGVSLYTSRIILQALGFEDFGLYNVVGGIVTMFTFLNGSLAGATSRFITFELGRKNYERLNQIFNTALAVHIFIALIIVIFAETIGLWFFYEKMTIPPDRLDAAFWVYQISIFTCFITLTQVPYNATIIAHENMKIYAYVGVVEVIAKLAISYAIYLAPFDQLVFYALLLCILQISIMFFYRFYCSRNFPESKIKICREKPLYREMLSYAGSDMIGQISVLAQGQGLNILLNLFFGPAVNAARGIAYQVQGAITQFSSNFMTAVKPQIIKSYANNDIDGMMKLVKNSSCFSFYLMWMISLPILLEADYILKLWLSDYPDHTVTFLRLIIILCLLQTIKTPRLTVFHATGHIKRLNLIVGIILCMAFPFAYIWLKLGGSPESVFWASIITFVVSEFASIAILKRYISYSIKEYLKAVYLKCAIVSLVSFIIPYFTYTQIANPGLQRFILTLSISCISVIISSFYLGMNKEMRKKLVGFIKKKQ